MKKFLFIFIFIVPFLYAQDRNYFWNDVGITLQRLLNKMDAPDDIQYQDKSENYWMAYEFGDAAVIYIVNKAIVSNVVYMKNNKDYDGIYYTFSELYRIAKLHGFYSGAFSDNHFKLYRNGIEMTGNISIVKTEFVLTILVQPMKQ